MSGGTGSPWRPRWWSLGDGQDDPELGMVRVGEQETTTVGLEEGAGEGEPDAGTSSGSTRRSPPWPTPHGERY